MRFALLASLAACACSGGGGSSPAPAPPPPAGPPVVAETAVPVPPAFPAACGGAGGTVYRNAEVEPHLVVDPRDANHLVAAWQQDRWSNGSARGLMVGVSFDGGASWSARPLPVSECGGGTAGRATNFLRATDPWLAFGADGTVYAIGLGTSGGSFTPGSTNAILVTRSSDGGRTWTDPVALIRDGGSFLDDKETVTADPRDARLVYATWDRVENDTAGPAYFTRSTDGGASWEAPRIIFDPGRGAQTIGNVIHVLPDGTLVDVYVRLVGDDEHVTEAAVEVLRSTDRGASWSPPIRVSAYRALGASDPRSGARVRDGSTLAQGAVAPDGSLAVVWQDARFSGVRDAIALARSTDGGLTWSTPVRVNADATLTAFTPQVAVRTDGTLGVSYFTLRAERPDASTLPADRRVAQSVDGEHWSEIGAGPAFDLAAAPLAGGGYFLGDYVGLASAGTTFLSLYPRTTGAADNPTDLVLGRIPAAAKAAAAYRAQPLPATEPGGDFAARVAAHLARTRASLRERSGTPSPAPTPAP